jgi:hypothetical protein
LIKFLQLEKDTESEKLEASVQKRLLEEEKKKQGKMAEQAKKDLEAKIRLEVGNLWEKIEKNVGTAETSS